MVSEAAKKKAAAKKAAAAVKRGPLKGQAAPKGLNGSAEEDEPPVEPMKGDPSPWLPNGSSSVPAEQTNGAPAEECASQVASAEERASYLAQWDAPREGQVARISFPTTLSARQRAILHEVAEENGLSHASVGETEHTRRLAIWRDVDEGDMVAVPSRGLAFGDAELADIVSRFLGLDVRARLCTNEGTPAQHPPSGATGKPAAPPQEKGRGGFAGFGRAAAEDMSMEKFVHIMGPLISFEKEAEMAASSEASASWRPETAQRRGRVLLNLRCSDAQTGLLGKSLLTLEPNRGALLPPHKFAPHDVVALKPSKADPSAPALGQGIVYRVKDASIVVAVDDLPEDGLDAPLRIEKLANDVTYKRLKDTLGQLRRGGPRGAAADLVPVLFGERKPAFAKKPVEFSPFNPGLDASQREAVSRALGATDVMLLHGPPGTGKTTAVVEVILQEVKRGHKVLACCASNIATDNLTERLAHRKGVSVTRLGHPARLLPSVLDCALDAQVLKTDNSALANDVRKEMRDINGKLLRCRNKTEKAQLRRELRQLAKEERLRQQRAVADVIKDSHVILSTLTGVASFHLQDTTFDLVVIDEAAQALEVASWMALLKARRCVLAGDHLQLPPTVLSPDAEKGGLGVTLFERLARLYGQEVIALLTVQYRMHERIMAWSSQELYEGKLTAHPSVAAHTLEAVVAAGGAAARPKAAAAAHAAVLLPPLVLIDTAGCDMEEVKEEEGGSTLNEGEARVVLAHAHRLLAAGLTPDHIGIITPYSAQVGLLKEMRGEDVRMAGVEVSTVDGFQGREKEAIIISMVRSNAGGEVGFLADNRRMNVAVTRARRQCCVVCDSETVSHDPFLKRMLAHFEEHGELLSAMEFVS